MDLNAVGYRMMALLKLTDGRKFRGLVQVNNVLRTQTDIADYLLHVNRKSFIAPGMVMWYDGVKFILGRGVTEFEGEPKFRNLRMVEVNETLPWTRSVKTIDPVSKLEMGLTETNLGTVEICRIASSKLSDAFRTNDSKYKLITNSNVKVDDLLGPYRVMFVEERHGLYYGEVR